MAPPLNKIKFIETTKLNKYRDTALGAWDIHPDLPYPRNGPSFKLLVTP
jgi:hypothetical protein